jgi:hypothetical protein
VFEQGIPLDLTPRTDRQQGLSLLDELGIIFPDSRIMETLYNRVDEGPDVKNLLVAIVNSRPPSATTEYPRPVIFVADEFGGRLVRNVS